MRSIKQIKRALLALGASQEIVDSFEVIWKASSKEQKQRISDKLDEYDKNVAALATQQAELFAANQSKWNSAVIKAKGIIGKALEEERVKLNNQRTQNIIRQIGEAK